MFKKFSLNTSGSVYCVLACACVYLHYYKYYAWNELSGSTPDAEALQRTRFTNPSQNPHNTKAGAKREYINKLVLCLAYMGSPTNGLRPYIKTQHLGNNFHIWLWNSFDCLRVEQPLAPSNCAGIRCCLEASFAGGRRAASAATHNASAIGRII